MASTGCLYVLQIQCVLVLHLSFTRETLYVFNIMEKEIQKMYIDLLEDRVLFLKFILV